MLGRAQDICALFLAIRRSAPTIARPARQHRVGAKGAWREEEKTATGRKDYARGGQGLCGLQKNGRQ